MGCYLVLIGYVAWILLNVCLTHVGHFSQLFYVKPLYYALFSRVLFVNQDQCWGKILTYERCHVVHPRDLSHLLCWKDIVRDKRTHKIHFDQIAVNMLLEG